MKRMAFLVFMVILCLVGCDTGTSGPVSPSLPAVAPQNSKSAVQFVSQESTAKGARALDASFIPESLFFGEVEILGYDYRPGETLQNHHPAWGMSDPDWSYWEVRLGGSPAMADNLLEAGKSLVLDPKSQQPFDEAYFKAVESFDIDMLEVFTVGFGIIKGGKFYTGQMQNSYFSNKNALYKYPELDASVTYEPTLFTTDGTIPFWWGVSSIFVRGDWLTAPVTAYSEEIGKIKSTSRELTASERTLIEKWMTNGCPNRRYSNIITFIPYEGLKKIYFIQHDYDGVSTFIAGNVKLEVNFDFSKILDYANSSLDPMTSPPQPGLVNYGTLTPPAGQVYHTLRLYEDSVGKRFGLTYLLSSTVTQ